MTERFTPPDYQDYLGDGVYASFDGEHVWLAVNHHSNNVVALDSLVFKALIDYRERLIAAHRDALLKEETNDHKG
jgi:hypothetical protein